MWAFLLANAAAARFLPRRAMRAFSHRLRSSCFESTPRSVARAPWTNNFRRELSPRVLIPRSRGVPPVECSRGTNPSQAENWRPFVNGVASPIAVIRAVALTGPIPGMVYSMQQPTDLVDQGSAGLHEPLPDPRQGLEVLRLWLFHGHNAHGGAG
jgi:hypothetical protein